MSAAFTAPFIEAIQEAPIRVVRGAAELQLLILEATAQADRLQVLMRTVYLENGQIWDINEQEVDWVVLNGGVFDLLEPAALEPLALAYADGWRAAVQARLEAMETLKVFMPAGCVPTPSKCPLRLKSQPQTAAEFEALFMVKSRLPGLPV